jgi:integrase
MASLQCRNNVWQVRIRIKGQPTVSKSFRTHKEALNWASVTEGQIGRNEFIDSKSASLLSLGDLIQRYMQEVTPLMKGATTDLIKLAAIRRAAISQRRLTALTPQVVARHRDERLAKVSNGTVIRELAYLSAIINHGRREWGINIVNPILMVRKPVSPQGRQRVLSSNEQEAVLAALEPSGRRNRFMHSLVGLALETAMRRGELLSLKWENINLIDQTALLEDTKNGDRRVVPLSTKAVSILQSVSAGGTGTIFPIEAGNVFARFKHAVKSAKLNDVRFHDLRHTAITQMSTKLPNVIELSSVTGHRNLAMLKRYYHPDAKALAKKLG